MTEVPELPAAANARLIALAPAMAEELVALRAENARLRKALTFYANPEVYRPHPHGPAFDRRDVSYVATAALTPEAKS